MVEMMLSCGANKALKNNDGHTALDVANAFEKHAVVALLSK